MEAWITAVIQEYGYIALFLLMLVETVFPPLPSELIMPFAGILASNGTLSPGIAVFAGTMGSFLGALLLYGVARAYGEQRVLAWVERHGRKIQLKPADVERANAFFRRWPWLAVSLARMLPGLRSLVSLPAGTARLPVALFALLTFVGTAAWSTLLAFAGWFLAEQLPVIQESLSLIGKLILAVGIAALLGMIIKRYRSAVKLK